MTITYWCSRHVTHDQLSVFTNNLCYDHQSTLFNEVRKSSYIRDIKDEMDEVYATLTFLSDDHLDVSVTCVIEVDRTWFRNGV